MWDEDVEVDDAWIRKSERSSFLLHNGGRVMSFLSDSVTTDVKQVAVSFDSSRR
jgi:hypothetical protein